MKNKIHIGVRISFELDQYIDQLQKRLQKRSAGLVVDRSEIIRNLLERGVISLEEELKDNG